MTDECPLCNAIKTEVVLEKRPYQGFYVLPTKDKKGHKFRYMIVSSEHVADLNKDLTTQGVSYLMYYVLVMHPMTTFEILEPTHATVKEHWHRIASSVDSLTETDFDKITHTDRIRIEYRPAADTSCYPEGNYKYPHQLSPSD